MPQNEASARERGQRQEREREHEWWREEEHERGRTRERERGRVTTTISRALSRDGEPSALLALLPALASIEVEWRRIDPESYDIKWRMARVIYNLSKSTPSPKKEELVRESFQFATDALALNDKDYASHKWYSILLDAKSGLDGIKERITQLENVKKHMLKAVELNPNDATSWYILGQFYYGLADLPWYQRKIVSTIFAAPPSGSYEEALECFEKAEKTKPNFYSMNHLMLGKTSQALKQNDKAKEYLTLAANVVVLNEDDKQAKEEAAKLLKKL